MAAEAHSQKIEIAVHLKGAPFTDGISPRKLVIKWMLGGTYSIRAELSGPDRGPREFWHKKFYNISNSENAPLPEWLLPIVREKIDEVYSYLASQGV
jgi:hypothetical protein